MNMYIVAGGPSECLPLLTRGSESECWIAVDGGMTHLMNSGIIPNYFIGDFDSSSNLHVYNQIPYLEFPKEKAKTDLELAIDYALKQNPTSICIYGATGGRIDHEMMNFQLLLKCLNSLVPTMIVDRQNKIFLQKPGIYTINKSSYKYISFLSYFEQVQEITLEGFKYPLLNARLENGSSLCISNELISTKGTYSFTSGILMVIESCD